MTNSGHADGRLGDLSNEIPTTIAERSLDFVAARSSRVTHPSRPAGASSRQQQVASFAVKILVASTHARRRRRRHREVRQFTGASPRDCDGGSRRTRSRAVSHGVMTSIAPRSAQGHHQRALGDEVAKVRELRGGGDARDGSRWPRAVLRAARVGAVPQPTTKKSSLAHGRRRARAEVARPRNRAARRVLVISLVR